MHIMVLQAEQMGAQGLVTRSAAEHRIILGDQETYAKALMDWICTETAVVPIRLAVPLSHKLEIELQMRTLVRMLCIQ